MSDTKKRIITAIVMVAVFVPVLWAGGIAVDILLALLGIIAGYETTVMLKKELRIPISICSAIAILCMIFIPEEKLVAVVALWLIVLLGIRIIGDQLKTDEVGAIYMMTLLVGIAFHEFHVIFSEPHPFDQMIYILIATTFTDVGAWFFGRMFGKHKMAPTISPKKTWEGSIAGYFCGALCSLLYAFIRQGSFDFNLCIVLSFCIPAVAEIGDLAFSCVKREYGVKDFGKLLPGHGGILDRFDSLTFSLIIHYVVAIFF